MVFNRAYCTCIHQDVVVHHEYECCCRQKNAVCKGPVKSLPVLSCTTYAPAPQTQTTRCVITQRFVSDLLFCMSLHACILCSQLCYSGYFVSDSIAADMSLKLYAVCQCKLVSGQSVNMTNSLVYNIETEK